MGKVEKLPGSKPLGPRSGGETSFNQGGPKRNKRAVGAAQSAMRASNPDITPAEVKKGLHLKKEARREVEDRRDDLIVGVSLDVFTVPSGEIAEEQTVVFGNVIPATLGNVFPEPSIDPFFSESGLRAATEIARIYPGGSEISLEALQDREAVDDYDPQELLDFGTTAIDKSDTIS